MALTVRRSRGIIVEYGEETIVFDPTSNLPCKNTFISHAHADHAAAFRFKDKQKYSTEETLNLVNPTDDASTTKWTPIAPRRRIKIGDLELEAHYAGHVLGSVQYEVFAPEGNLLYTGDFNYVDTYTMKAAEEVPCDLLVVETTFGSPAFTFPPRDRIALDIVKWSVKEVIEKGKIPAFQTDSIGNAQELVTIFNRMTRLPVITTPAITKANKTYEEYGYKLEYVDAGSEEGAELLSTGSCVLIASKGSNLSRYQNLETAFASGWAVLLKHGDRTPFPLSDHADFRQLLSFIRRCAPKRVLAFHGSRLTQDFASLVTRRLGIEASNLTDQAENLRGRLIPETARVDTCRREIMELVRIPGFEYTKKWLIREMARRGFSKAEVDQALKKLLDQGPLTCLQGSDKIRLG